MTAVLDPDAVTGFNPGKVYYSAEDSRFYLLTDSGAIPTDGPRELTTLNDSQLSAIGSDYFTLRDGQLDLMRPASPNTATYEDTMYANFFAGGVSLAGSSGFSQVRRGLRLNFLSGGSLDPRITFTRASTAWRVNASGLIEAVSSNLPRIDYDPVTLACKGLLIEEQRTNLLLRSQEFDNASWSKTNTTVTADQATSPDGTTNADLVVLGTLSDDRISQGVAVTNATVYTLSFYARSVTGSTTWQYRVWLGASYGATQSAALTTTWQRFTYTFTANATGTAFIILGTNLSAVGSNVSAYLWQADLQAGSFTTSAAATTSATVTRAADVASMSGTNFSSWFNQTAGTITVQAKSPGSGTRVIWQADDGTANNRYTLYTTGTSLKFDVVTGGVTQASLTLGTITANTTFKAACAFAADDIAAVLNAGTVQTDTGATLPTVDRYRLGADTTGNYLCEHIERNAAYPARLSNALLQSLTA